MTSIVQLCVTEQAAAADRFLLAKTYLGFKLTCRAGGG